MYLYISIPFCNYKSLFLPLCPFATFYIIACSLNFFSLFEALIILSPNKFLDLSLSSQAIYSFFIYLFFNLLILHYLTKLYQYFLSYWSIIGVFSLHSLIIFNNSSLMTLIFFYFHSHLSFSFGRGMLL